MKGETHVYDIRQQDVPVLLTSIIRVARERGLHVWIRTRRHLVAADTGIATLGYESFSASRRIRVFVADAETGWSRTSAWTSGSA